MCDRPPVSSSSPSSTDNPVAVDGALNLCAPDGVALHARVHEPDGSSPTATAVLVHGINTDLDEGGMYVRLADRLADGGVGVLRFSFRGHGRSGGTARGVTIAGEMLDLEAVVAAARNRWPGVPLVVVASSVGAVATLETAHFTQPDLVVLWNPVLDLRRTFVEPELPWGRQNFHSGAWTAAQRDGFLLLDGEFELGRVLLDELHRYDPLASFIASNVPALVVHGSHDSYVSYEVSRRATAERGCELHTVHGSDHGFDTREREDEAIDVTASWLIDRIPSVGVP
jgi:alpha-beta hydrolase superfamily lysophospholipase